MNEDIFADVKKEGSDPFETLEKETLSESQPEKEPENAKPEEGEETKVENTPDKDQHFHERWKSHAENLKRELEEKHQAELRQMREEFESRIPSKKSDIPDWFVELYGENQVAWQKYEEHERAKETEIERRVVERQEQAKLAQQQEAEKWNMWVENEISRLQGEGKQFDRNELLKVILENRPTTADGKSFDFDAGYRIYEAVKAKEIDPARSQARKMIGDTTTKSSTTGEKKAKDYLTPNDLRNKSWQSL